MLHIDLPTRAEIEKLAAHRGAPTVSIYLATTPLTQNTDADRIELKNLLKAAVEEMEEAGTPKRSIWPIEEAVNGLIEDHDFWADQANSLAIFVSDGTLRTYRLPNRLQNIVAAEQGPFPRMNPEFVVRADPDLILIGVRNAHGLENRPGWRGMRAVPPGCRRSPTTPACASRRSAAPPA